MLAARYPGNDVLPTYLLGDFLVLALLALSLQYRKEKNLSLLFTSGPLMSLAYEDANRQGQAQQSGSVVLPWVQRYERVPS